MKRRVMALVLAAVIAVTVRPWGSARAEGTVYETVIAETGYGEINNLVSNKQEIDGQWKSVSETGELVGSSAGYQRYPVYVDGGDRSAHVIDCGGGPLGADASLTVRYGLIGYYYPGRVSMGDGTPAVPIGALVTMSRPVNLVRMALFDNFWYGGMIDACGGRPGGRADYSITFFRSDTGETIRLGGDAQLIASSLDGWPFEPKVSYEGISFYNAPETWVTYRGDGNIVRGGEELFGVTSYYTATRKAAYEDIMEDKLFINCGVAFRQNSETWNCAFVTQTDHSDGHGDWFYFTANPVNLIRPPRPEKTADDALYHVGDTVTYRIAQRVASTPEEGYGSYGSFQFIDRLPAGLDYVSASLSCSDGEVPEGAGTVAYDEAARTVTYTFSPDYLRSLSYRGQTYTFEIVCRINGAALGGQAFANTAEVAINGETVLTPASEVTPYYKITTEAVNGVIDPEITGIPAGEARTVSYEPNPGYWLESVTVDGEEQEPETAAKSFTWENIASNHRIKVVFAKMPDEASIRVTKRIRAEDVVFDHGNPTFLFRAEGTDIRGRTRVCYRAVTITPEIMAAQTDEEGFVSCGTVFTGLVPGNYVVSEEQTNRYALESVSGVTEGVAEGDRAVFRLEGGRQGTAVFTNRKYEQGGLSDSALAENQVGR